MSEAGLKPEDLYLQIYEEFVLHADELAQPETGLERRSSLVEPAASALAFFLGGLAGGVAAHVGELLTDGVLRKLKEAAKTLRHDGDPKTDIHAASVATIPVLVEGLHRYDPVDLASLASSCAGYLMTLGYSSATARQLANSALTELANSREPD